MPDPILLPTYLSARSAGETISACNHIAADNDIAIVDAGALKFADPFGLALLGATFQMVSAQGKTVRVRNISGDMAGYLQRMDVFAGVTLEDCQPVPARRHDRSDALVELTRIDVHRAVEEMAHRLACALVGHMPGIDPNEAPDEMTGYTTQDRLVEPLQYALNELLENALTHARRKGHPNASVWVASQYYAKKGLIRLGIVDNGCGFLATLHDHPALHHPRHLDAILTALQPRVSCNRDLRMSNDSVNQGVGLTTTCRIAEHAGGRLVIVSGDAVHDTACRSGNLTGNAYWQGVAIAMECRRNRLPDIRFRELLPPLDAQRPTQLRFE